jgi:FkbM family methyltransferase
MHSCTPAPGRYDALAALPDAALLQAIRALYAAPSKPVEDAALAAALRGRVLPVPVPGGTLLVELGDWTSLLIVRMGGWEPHLGRLCARLVTAGQTVLDLGAHSGAYTMLLAQLVGPDGRVVAFEPHAPSVELLRAALGAAPNVVIEAAAVSDREGTASLFAWQPNEGGPSRYAGADRMLHSLVRADGYGAAAEVALVTLDAWAARTGLARADFVKIDVEGAELAVLRGARRLLGAEGVRLLLELHAEELVASGASVGDVLEELDLQGFVVFDIVPAGDRILLGPLAAGQAPTTHHVLAQRGGEAFEVSLVR